MWFEHQARHSLLLKQHLICIIEVGQFQYAGYEKSCGNVQNAGDYSDSNIAEDNIEHIHVSCFNTEDGTHQYPAEVFGEVLLLVTTKSRKQRRR